MEILAIDKSVAYRHDAAMSNPQCTSSLGSQYDSPS